MVKHTRYKFFAALTVAFLILSAPLPLTDKSWAQALTELDIAPLIEKLKSNDESERENAVDTLVEKGGEAVPALREALKDRDKEVRRSAAYALEQIGAEAASAVPELKEALKDRDKKVRRSAAYALEQIGAEAASAVPELKEALKDRDKEVRRSAANTLQEIGAEAASAVPELREALKDDDKEVRRTTAYTLELLGAEAASAVPDLRAAVHNDSDKEVRRSAIYALEKIGVEASAVVSDLRTALRKDSDKEVHRTAAEVLGNMRAEAASAVPDLRTALKTPEVRDTAADALGRIAISLQDKAKANMLPPSQLDQAISNLEEALKILEDPEAKFSKESIAGVRRPLDVLKAQKNARLVNRMLQNKWVSGGAIYLVSLPSLWFLLLWLHPLWLLRINDALKPYTDFTLPVIGIKVPLRLALFVSFFHYHPRVLDAWVAAHLNSAREEFQEKDTVRDRKIYIPMSVVLDGKTVAQLIGKDLRSTFKKQRGCLLIWGEGGVGKTSLACQIAKWAISDDEAQRLCEHRMLPVLIEEELDFEAAGGKPPFIAAIRGQLQDLSNETEAISEELLERLLRQRRVLVIVDHFSEMSEATRKAIRPESPDFPVNALVITSRTEEKLGQVTKSSLKPLRIEGNHLSSFMEAYLMQRGKRDSFTDSEFFDACSRLSTMVGQRNITVLLAKLYAEQMIAAKEGLSVGDLPNNIPDLMLCYLNELNRSVTGDKLDNRTVQQDAKAIAWECLKGTFRSATGKRESAIVALNEDNAEVRLEYLENRLHLIQTIGPAQDKIRFALDPLAEYLAGLHLVGLYGDHKDSWRNFLDLADSQPGGADAIKGFLSAVQDCCLAPCGAETKVPEFVVEELGKRTSLSQGSMNILATSSESEATINCQVGAVTAQTDPS